MNERWIAWIEVFIDDYVVGYIRREAQGQLSLWQVFSIKIIFTRTLMRLVWESFVPENYIYWISFGEMLILLISLLNIERIKNPTNHLFLAIYMAFSEWGYDFSTIGLVPAQAGWLVQYTGVWNRLFYCRTLAIPTTFGFILGNWPQND